MESDYACNQIEAPRRNERPIRAQAVPLMSLPTPLMSLPDSGSGEIQTDCRSVIQQRGEAKRREKVPRAVAEEMTAMRNEIETLKATIDKIQADQVMMQQEFRFLKETVLC
jgi:hypothetical protein